MVYGVFTTPDNAIAGSAICAFKMSDITTAFEEGPFKNQDNANSNWLPTSKSQIPQVNIFFVRFFFLKFLMKFILNSLMKFFSQDQDYATKILEDYLKEILTLSRGIL